MVRLVEDLLDVSRIARGKIALKKQRVDLRDTVAKAIETASALLDQRRHRVQVDAPAHELAVEGDDARLTQVFANLVTNAAKYTNPGGNIQIVVERQGGDAVVQVIDNGVGIDPSLLSRIFDLFVQAPEHSGMDDSPVSPVARARAGGLGIGLTLVRKLVALHGGTVVAHSDGPGRGSKFTVRLPALAERAATAG